MTSKAYTAVKQDDIDVDVDVEEATIVKTSRRGIPEARELTWTDTYFEETETAGVIAVFDLDYDLARKRLRRAQCSVLVIGVFYAVFLPLAGRFDGDTPGETGYMVSISVYMICLVIFTVYHVQKVFLGIQGCHLAVTEAGIHKVTNGFPFGSFFRTSTVVRYVLCSNKSVNSTIFVELDTIDTRTHALAVQSCHSLFYRT
jgi:hypothetical protein